MDHFRFVVNQTMAAKSWTAYGGAKFTADMANQVANVHYVHSNQ